METKEQYGTVSVSVSMRDLQKCKELADYFHMTPNEALHYVIRKGIECVLIESRWPEVHDD